MWSIAGFDPSGGAGVTADLFTFASFGLFGCSAITALTVQTTQGVFATELVPSSAFRATLDHLREDLPPLGIKVGMLGSAEIAREIATVLRSEASTAKGKPLVVLDPVLRSTSGKALLSLDALPLLHAELLPLVDWITPNWDELGILAGAPVATEEEARHAANTLLLRHPHLAVVATGGDAQVPTELLFQAQRPTHVLTGQHVETRSTHGTGCAFSSALLSLLVQGADSLSAVRGAKYFVEGALRYAPEIGKGRGPMELLWPFRNPEGDLLP